MILVTLGTQDKDFSRLLRAVEKEIKNGTIKDKVVVQAGHTKFSSKVMEIFDFISGEELEQLIKKASLVITHGGVGSITTAIKYKKKIIAAARLKRYHEHTNDHQVQIIKKFAERGYLLELKDFHTLGSLIKKAQTMQFSDYKESKSRIPMLVDEQIQQWREDGILSRGRKFREVFLYLIFGGLTTIINVLVYFVLARLFMVNYQISTVIAWILSVLFAFFTNKLFVFESKNQTRKEDFKEVVSFFAFRILSLGIDMASMYLMVQALHLDDLVSKIVANVIVVIVNYLFSKLFIFKK